MDNKSVNRTELESLGKHALEQHLLKYFNLSSNTNFSNDVIKIKSGNDYTIIANTLLTEGIHFDLTYFPLQHLGYKAVVIAMSDIIAVNGTVSDIFVNISVSNRFSLEALEEFYKGIKYACDRYKINFNGTDVVSSVYGFTISIVSVGKVAADKLVGRNTANENDLICLSGDVGAAYSGLLLLEREKAVFKANDLMQPDLEGFDYILERQLKPEARTDIIDLFKNMDLKPTSMGILKDGLASELLNICNLSDKGATIYEDKLPIDAQTISFLEEVNIQSATAALNGGEDYEVLFTISLNDFEKVKHLSEFVIIGHITEKNQGVNIATINGPLIPIKTLGYKVEE